MKIKTKFAWSKNLEVKRREDRYQEREQNDKNNYQEYRGDIRKVKRHRSAFTTEQVKYLEKEFRKHPYIGNLRRKDVANVMNIPERAVKIWFQNRRMKEKKDAMTKEIVDEQKQAKTDGIDEPLTTSALVTNGAPLPVLRITEAKQDDKDVACGSDLRIKKNSPVLTRTDKDVPIMKTFSKPSNFIANISAVNNTEISPEMAFFNRNKNVSDAKIKSESENTRVLEVSPKIHKISPIFKHQSNFVSSPSSNLPQDLSSSSFASHSVFSRLNHKPSQELNEQRNVQASMASMNLPLYLKYPQPYIPPGNMIWKPINVAPIMSTGLPAATMANSGTQQSYVPSKSCSCDCHLKQFPNQMLFQQSSPNPLVQYVITAVPFQNHTPKF